MIKLMVFELMVTKNQFMSYHVHDFILSHISSSAHECVQWFRILVSHWPDWEFFMVSKIDNKNWQAIAFKWYCDHKVNPHRFDFRWRSYSWDIRDIRVYVNVLSVVYGRICTECAYIQVSRNSCESLYQQVQSRQTYTLINGIARNSASVGSGGRTNWNSK